MTPEQTEERLREIVAYLAGNMGASHSRTNYNASEMCRELLADMERARLCASMVAR